MEITGIVDISPQRYRIDVLVPQTAGNLWESETSFWTESQWRFWVKVYSADGGRIAARAGIKVRDDVFSHSCLSLRVIADHREIPLESAENGSVVPNLRQFITRRGRLKLVLIVSPEYKDTNDYLARNIVVPPTELGSNLKDVSQGSKRDVRLICRDNRHVYFHSDIVGLRAPVFKERSHWWPEKLSDCVTAPVIRSEWILDVWVIILSYLYTDKLPPLSDNLRTELEVLRWASEFRTHRLLSLVELRLAKILSPDNILAISTWCLRNCKEEIPQLQEALIEFMGIPSNRYSTIQDLIKPPYRRWNHKVPLNLKDIIDFIAEYDIVDEAISYTEHQIRVDFSNERLLRAMLDELGKVRGDESEEFSITDTSSDYSD